MQSILVKLLRHARAMVTDPKLRLLLGAAVALIALPWSCHYWQASTQQPCTVVNIHDGDTMRLNCNGEKLQVRLWCIDAPEVAQAPWGVQSRDYLRTITPSQVQLITHDKDRYGRIVGELLAGENQHKESLNLAQVRAGQAAVYPQYCDDVRFFAAEKEARRRQIGIWGKSGIQQTPWDYRHEHSK